MVQSGERERKRVKESAIAHTLYTAAEEPGLSWNVSKSDSRTSKEEEEDLHKHDEATEIDAHDMGLPFGKQRRRSNDRAASRLGCALVNKSAPAEVSLQAAGGVEIRRPRYGPPDLEAATAFQRPCCIPIGTTRQSCKRLPRDAVRTSNARPLIAPSHSTTLPMTLATLTACRESRTARNR